MGWAMAWYAHRWALWAGEELAHWPCSELDYTMVGGRGEGGRRGGEMPTEHMLFRPPSTVHTGSTLQ